MAKRFITNENLFPDIEPEHEIPLPADIIKHALIVTRLKTGDTLEIQTPQKRRITARITSHEIKNPKIVVLNSVTNPPTPISPSIHAFIAMIKWPRFEWALEKLAELGVTTITPVISHRCIIKIDTGVWNTKFPRFNKILTQAARQSLANQVPELKPPLNFTQSIQTITKISGCALIASTTDCPPISKAQIYYPVAFLTGPEGGFCENEINDAINTGIQPVKLTENILRAETAPVVITAYLMLRALD